MCQKPKYSLFLMTSLFILYAISSLIEIPSLQKFYESLYLYILSYSQNVDISLKLLLPISGMIISLLIGYHCFENKIIENGICMIFGILINSFGILTILSGSNNDTIIQSMFCFTTILIVMGITRKLYIPSTSDIKKLAKEKIKEIIRLKNKRKIKKKELKQAIKHHNVEYFDKKMVKQDNQKMVLLKNDKQDIKQMNQVTNKKEEQATDSESVGSSEIQDPIEYLADKVA